MRVPCVDDTGGQLEKTVSITVTEVNDDPTNIPLSSQAVAENQATGTAVGNFSTTDTDSSTFTYSLVAGGGDTGNGSFTIVGAQLRTAAVFDAETQSSYSIRVQTDDGEGGQFQKTFTITVTDVNDDPTNITLSSQSVAENQATGTAVGNFSTTDTDSSTFTYTLVAGAGATDNGSFAISGNVLQTAAVFDAETQSSYSIRVQTDDGAGGLFEKTFTITVTDVNDDPTHITLSSHSFAENQAKGTAVCIFMCAFS